MRSSFLMFFACLAVQAQDSQVGAEALFSTTASTAETTSSYVPLTPGQNYMWSVHQIFDWDALFAVSAAAGFDHARNAPWRWGRGPEGYAERVGSRMGILAVRENLAFGVRALDHEDPRYFRAGHGGTLQRSRYAVSRAFVAKNRHGDIMPAYSIFASSLATPFVADAWRPEHVRPGRELRSAGIGIGMKAANNLVREFWPDIRKKLKR